MTRSRRRHHAFSARRHVASVRTGKHTDAIMKDWGFSADEIAASRADGAVASAPG
jgi:crotonobetainyl-CoA:carnitine CoA-transferase CaiB-like acyl-CoA transferase